MVEPVETTAYACDPRVSRGLSAARSSVDDMEPSPRSSVRDAPARWESQRTFDELGRPLRDITFCVVDLETTGGSAEGGSMITEIGAVKVRGGEVLGEFQTLVNPRTEIPAFIAVLTGISNSMVADAPPIESALPAFLEFAAGTVLVAHNAPFDVGFLRHFAEQQGRAWPRFEVLATARLARPHEVWGPLLPAMYFAENLDDDTVSSSFADVAVDVVARED